MKLYEEIEKMTYAIQRSLVTADMAILRAPAIIERGDWEKISDETRFLVREALRSCGYLNGIAADMRDDDPELDDLCPFCHEPYEIATEGGQGISHPDHTKCRED